jgi:tetratricopeptide (TPR) repeat protein
MSAVFWIATIVMAALAFSFVAPPLMRNNRRFGLVGVALALPAFAASLYWLVGSPQAASINPPATSVASASRDMNRTSGKSVGSVASMTDGLAARLTENPDDGKSWLLLAKSYHHLKRLPEAREAYEKAVALGEYDETLATSFDAPAAEETGARIFGNVKLSERSKAIVKPTDTVFIFARAVDGPPMPVAVLQRPVSELPLDFLLNDSQAMSADMKLSNFERVVVTARVSSSGVATDALQDLEAKSESIVVAENRHLDLLID